MTEPPPPRCQTPGLESQLVGRKGWGQLRVTPPLEKPTHQTNDVAAWALYTKAVQSPDWITMKNAIIAIAILAFAPSVGAESQPAKPPVQYIAIFDFACKPKAALGAKLAHSIRMRLGRKKHLQAINHLTMADTTPVGGVGLATDEKHIAELLANSTGANAAIWGNLQCEDGDEAEPENLASPLTATATSMPRATTLQAGVTSTASVLR